MDPHRAGLHAGLGNVYWALSEWDAALIEFRAELVNDPKNCVAQAQIGEILIQQRMNVDDGLSAEEKALAMCPKLTQAHVNRGRALMSLNRHEEALMELETAEQATPEDPQVHFFLAQAYRSLGQAQKAESEMETFSKLEESARANSAERAKEVIQQKEDTH